MRDTRRYCCGLVIGLAALLGAVGWPAAQAQQCLVSPSGLVGWWTGDVDFSDIVGGADGAPMSGAVAGAPGYVAGAFDFRGTGGYFVAPSDDAFNFGDGEEFTIAAWIKIAPSAIDDADPLNVSGVIAWKEGSQDGNVQGWRFGVTPRRAQANTPPSAELFLAAKSGSGGRVQVNARIPAGILDDDNWHYVVARRIVTSGVARAFLSIDGVQGTPPPAVIPSGTLVNPGPIDVGDYSPSPGTHLFNGLIDELAIYDRALSDFELMDIYNAGVAGRCKTGVIEGDVLADCPDPDSGLLGVKLDVYAVSTGAWVADAVTDVDGSYEMPPLLAGDYTVTLGTPLGYGAPGEQGEPGEVEDVPVTIVGGDVVTASFDLECLDIVPSPRRASFWKRQIGRALWGWPAHYDSEELCGFLDTIEEHFNSNEINPVEIYEPPASGLCQDKLIVAKQLLNLWGNWSWHSWAKKQLMALLFNVASGKLSLTEVISEDGATVSQAITYCDNLIDDENGDHILAIRIAARVNRGYTVPAGWIPPETDNIAYREPMAGVVAFKVAAAEPNPFNPRTTIGFDLGEAGEMSVRVFDSHGRLIRSLADQVWRTAGSHRVSWDGVDDRGSAVASGVYFVQLTAAGQRATQRIVLMR